MTRIAFLPLDDRPVNYDYPYELAAMAGFEMERPQREWLGNPWRQSRHAELVEWLQSAVKSCNVILVAVDTLGYGGLIPSRTSQDSVDQVLENLSVLRKIKASKPDLVILAYSVILRISRDNTAEEEKEYWAEYGSRMFRLSTLEHKISLAEAVETEKKEQASLRRQIPESVYQDYKQGRKRNHAVNLAMLDWLDEGFFDYLLLPQDDTADYGWNIAEARSLQSLIRLKGLGDRAISYPGADETANLLLARLACRQAGFSPRLWPRYASVESAQTITAYEDRPIHELIKAHLSPLGGSLAESPEQADLLLFVNAPAEAQGAADLQDLIARETTDPNYQIPVQKDDLYFRTRREMTSPRRNVEEFIRAMMVACEAGQPVALADVAFVNGADYFLGRQLMQSVLPTHLLAYAGWNTAGNTLGTVLAHSMLRILMLRGHPTPTQQAAHAAFLFRRYLDDYHYQAIVRSQIMFEDLPGLGLSPTMERLPADKLKAVESSVQKRLRPVAEKLCDQFVHAGLVREASISNISLPWQRLFEIGFDVHVEMP